MVKYGSKIRERSAGGHAGPRVHHVQDHLAPLAVAAQGEGAAAGHGPGRVRGERHHHLLQRVGVDRGRTSPVGIRETTRTRAKAGWRSSSRRAVPTVARRSAARPRIGPRRVQQRADDALAARHLAADQVLEAAAPPCGRAALGAFWAREASTSAHPAIPARGFETSWATPATSCPR